MTDSIWRDKQQNLPFRKQHLLDSVFETVKNPATTKNGIGERCQTEDFEDISLANLEAMQ